MQTDEPRFAWQAAFNAVRRHSLLLTAGLSAEDQTLQSMADTSPTKWHLAHTSWFFETLLLQLHLPGYRPVDARWAALFNSYYESLGPRHPRPQRGLLSRPSLAEVLAYRTAVDAAVERFITGADDATWRAAVATLALGLQHEQQHQELMLTDILHAFSLNPLWPAYRPVAGAADERAAPPVATSVRTEPGHTEPGPPRWVALDGGAVPIGHDGDGFGFDNERPRHTQWLMPFAIASRLVSNADYAGFIADGGYRQPALWLSDGWATVQAQGWQAPAYWLPCGGSGDAIDAARSRSCDGFEHFSLQGLSPLDPAAPVCHLSGYEAAAYAAWAAARLPTEAEWEHAAHRHPAQLRQLQGAVWQWTASAYAPYPGFRPLPGPAAEYNGKFMINQMVLRGSSFATPPGHARLSYRNFFGPAARWQFSGLRLARDTGSPA
jgi:ergothioneine biosynthesis protein EgtB